MPPTSPDSSAVSFVRDALSICRYHIILVAMAAAVVFGWLFTGVYPLALMFIVALDWFSINLLNRVTDLEEDTRNAIDGTARVSRNKKTLTMGVGGSLLGSFVVTHSIWPQITLLRVCVHCIGIAYNYRVIPTFHGLSRLKEIYFFKNFGSSVLFVLTCFAYPLACYERVADWWTIVILTVFFLLYEQTYEIIYDLRDIVGDRHEKVPTYPVVHGPERARQIIDCLLAASIILLAIGSVCGHLGVRELLMGVAPILQFVLYRRWFRRGVSPKDCIVMTNLGTALLVFFLVGNWLWLAAGLPANIMLF